MAKKKGGDESHPMATTQGQIDEFERIAKQLQALHGEFAAQAKSKPDNAINTFKVKMLNEKIAIANGILAGALKPFDGFAQFDEATLPSNSDVSLVLTTYLASLERWRSARVTHSGYKWFWTTSDGSTIEAEPPTQYRPTR